ncbi:MAG: hypothetical protein IID08_04425 [Candidatus Hydrogenedentes bacterium]|nr:hypothetical protein [Candidatus Hydrogenedentota bacterium]
MNRIEHNLERLAERARQEEVPVGDVSAEVIRRIRSEEAGAPSAPLALFAAGYATLAATALVFGVSLFNVMNDPLAAMFEFGMGIAP